MGDFIEEVEMEETEKRIMERKMEVVVKEHLLRPASSGDDDENEEGGGDGEGMMTRMSSTTSLVRALKGSKRRSARKETCNECADVPTIGKEIAVLLKIAVPVSTTRTLVNLTRMLSLLFVGRMTAPEYLAAASLAGSVSGITGYSLFMAFVGGLRTLAGQAYGARDYEQVGYHLQCAIVLTTITATFSSFIWGFSKYLLILLGQEPLISHNAAAYLQILIPSLFFFAYRATIQAWCTIQQIVRPFTLNAAVTAVISIPLNYYLVKHIGYLGSAIATSTYTTVNIILDLLFVYYWGAYKKTWAPINFKRAMRSFWPMARLASASLIMTSEWWAAAFTVLMAGSLAGPGDLQNERTLSTMAIFQQVNGLAYMIPLGIQQAISVRVSNAMGAGNANVAVRSSACGLCLSFVVTMLFATVIYTLRYYIGAAFAPDDDILINLLASVMWMLAFYHICDGGCAAFSGVLTGVGRQRAGAVVVIFCYYGVGLPMSYLFGYRYGWGVKGLVLGRLAGKICHLCAYSFLVITMNWQKQVERAARIRREIAGKRSISLKCEFDEENAGLDGFDSDDEEDSGAVLMKHLLSDDDKREL